MYPIMRIIRRAGLQPGCWDRQIVSASEVELEKPYRLCRRNRQGAAAVEFARVASTAVHGDPATVTIPYRSVT